MLTRREVARRLRRSVATVRRIEGVLLFPERDARGVYGFDEDDVADLVAQLRAGDVQLWREVQSRYAESDWRAWLSAAPKHRRHEQHDCNAPPGGKSNGGFDRNDAASERFRALERENEELRGIARELVAIVNRVGTRRALRAMGRPLLEIMEAL